MGEISFLYKAPNWHGRVQPFCYLYSKTTEYSFAYQRYLALSDTSIFNSPVAITKVATGLSNLCGLFVSNSHDVNVFQGIDITKNDKDMSIFNQELITKINFRQLE